MNTSTHLIGIIFFIYCGFRQCKVLWILIERYLMRLTSMATDSLFFNGDG